MTDSSTLLLHIDQGRPLPVQIRRENAVRSPHTGRDLQELHGWIITTDSQLHQRLATMLPALGEHPMRSEDEAGEFTGRWCVSWNSYGEAAGVHTYTLILREAEELSLRALLLDDIELHPYEYREEPVSGGLVIRAKLVGSEDEVLRLRRLAAERENWKVVRQGIQDEPREMRLSVEEWSELDDRVKFRIALADSALVLNQDETEVETESESSRSALAFYANYLESLAEMLVAKGVVTREELRTLREGARADSGVIRHELWRVADVDQA
jgi:hypothetical protein